MKHRSVLILGAGPTGLGAAHRLTQLKNQDWLLIEKAATAGGLSRSVVDSQGFTWDMGGHVVFSHYKQFDLFLDSLLQDQWLEHRRESSIWMCNRFIPYPLQNHIWRLPDEKRNLCLEGLRSAVHTKKQSKPKNFDEWLRSSFGDGLYKLFLEPYNSKVWAHPPHLLNTEWMSERVATIDLNKIEKSITYQEDDLSWGPNSNFRFPRKGGTGAIWSALFKSLPIENFSMNEEVKSIDSKKKRVTTSKGKTYSYDFLVSTLPMNELLKRIEDQSKPETGEEWIHSSTHVIGIGLKGEIPDFLKKKSWFYFPESNCPFYRVTVFSNYSPSHVPDPAQHWSLLCEVSESKIKPVNSRQIIEEVTQGLKNVRFLNADSTVVSRWSTRLEYGYPIPFVGRDLLLKNTQTWLKSKNILSRGRFGGWKYEISNQDHSYMQGVEVVDFIVSGVPEKTYITL